MRDVHTKRNQQRSSSIGSVGKHLEKRENEVSGHLGPHRQIKEALTTPLVTQALENIVRQYNGPDVGHGTHLTVYWRCTIKSDHVEN
jgi:hypothetical protein